MLLLRIALLILLLLLHLNAVVVVVLPTFIDAVVVVPNLLLLLRIPLLILLLLLYLDAVVVLPLLMLLLLLYLYWCCVVFVPLLMLLLLHLPWCCGCGSLRRWCAPVSWPLDNEDQQTEGTPILSPPSLISLIILSTCWQCKEWRQTIIHVVYWRWRMMTYFLIEPLRSQDSCYRQQVYSLLCTLS